MYLNTKITAIKRKQIKDNQAKIFQIVLSKLSTFKNRREITNIIFTIKNIGSHLTSHCCINLSIITSDLYLSEILETISKLKGIVKPMTTASKDAISDRKLEEGVKEFMNEVKYFIIKVL